MYNPRIRACLIYELGQIAVQMLTAQIYTGVFRIIKCSLLIWLFVIPRRRSDHVSKEVSFSLITTFRRKIVVAELVKLLFYQIPQSSTARLFGISRFTNLHHSNDQITVFYGMDYSSFESW